MSTRIGFHILDMEKFAKMSIKEAELALTSSDLRARIAHIKSASIYMKIAEGQGKRIVEEFNAEMTLADLERMDTRTVLEYLTVEEREKLLKKIKNDPKQIPETGENK